MCYTLWVIIEWDTAKALANIDKHGLNFEIAESLFTVGRLIAYPDMRKEYGELRMIGLGMLRGRCLCVVFTMREGAVRIVSLRKANKREKAKFKKAWGV